MHRAVILRPTAILLLVALVLAGLVVYQTIAPAAGQQATTIQPSAANEIPVRTAGLYADGSVHKRDCKADALVVTVAGRISAIRAQGPAFHFGVSDAIPALQDQSGAFYVSVAADGTVQKGLRDCVEVPQ